MHQVWKNSPYRGRLNYFHFFEDLSVGCWHLDRFSILISRNWRARQARSYTFGITLSTDQGCASFWKNSLCRGRLNYFHFFEDLSIGSGHFDWFSLLISRNWRARQDCSFTFGITLSTEPDCPLSLKNSWLSDLMFCDYLRDKHLEVSWGDSSTSRPLRVGHLIFLSHLTSARSKVKSII